MSIPTDRPVPPVPASLPRTVFADRGPSGRAVSAGGPALCRLAALLLLLLAITSACGPAPPDRAPAESSDRAGSGAGSGVELRLGTAPPGGAFHIVGEALADVLKTDSIEPHWNAVAVATKGSHENILKLNARELDLALANAATTYFAGQDGYAMRVVMTLAPNVASFVTRRGSGIETISDLRGKRVTVGPDGAGFEFFLGPLLIAHDIYFDDFQPVYCSQSDAVEKLAANEVDAAFLGGAVPTASVTRACELMNIRFIKFEELPTSVLIDEFVFYHPVTVPGGVYPGQDDVLGALNVGSMHLIASAQLNEELVYAIARKIYRNRDTVVKRHPAGLAIEPGNVVLETGTPFHPGAIRFFKEIGIWPPARDPENLE